MKSTVLVITLLTQNKLLYFAEKLPLSKMRKCFCVISRCWHQKPKYLFRFCFCSVSLAVCSCSLQGDKEPASSYSVHRVGPQPLQVSGCRLLQVLQEGQPAALPHQVLPLRAAPGQRRRRAGGLQVSPAEFSTTASVMTPDLLSPLPLQEEKVCF